MGDYLFFHQQNTVSVKSRFLCYLLALILVFAAMCLQSCSGAGQQASSARKVDSDKIDEDPDAPDRDNTPLTLENTAPGVKSFSGEGATVDYSNAGDGYIMVKYQGNNNKVKAQITHEGEDTYTYDLRTDGKFEALPLPQGSGKYNVAVFLNMQGDQYMQAAKDDIEVNITDEFSPFLRPNQYVNYTEDDIAVVKAAELSAGAKSDLGAIKKMYDFVIKNIEYDYDKAKTVESGYLPDIDETLKTRKGICFDYASLMAAMFRSQRIPTKLVVGYADKAYHSWITCYVDGEGWIVNIHFDGANWYFMDPTFAAGGNKVDPNLIGSGTNYNPVYYY